MISTVICEQSALLTPPITKSISTKKLVPNNINHISSNIFNTGLFPEHPRTPRTVKPNAYQSKFIDQAHIRLKEHSKSLKNSISEESPFACMVTNASPQITEAPKISTPKNTHTATKNNCTLEEVIK